MKATSKRVLVLPAERAGGYRGGIQGRHKMKWEYQLRQVAFDDPGKTQRELNEVGDDGWELVAIFPKAAGHPGGQEMWGTAILKRPKSI